MYIAICDDDSKITSRLESGIRAIFKSLKDNVDVSKIAEKFGGGGHAKAAGASSLKELPKFLQKGNMWVSPKLLNQNN